MNKRLTTDMADANGLQRAIRPTGLFNIKKMTADFCSAQCIMDNTGSLISIDFGNFNPSFSPYLMISLRSYNDIKHSRECFIRYPNTSQCLHIVM